MSDPNANPERAPMIDSIRQKVEGIRDFLPPIPLVMNELVQLLNENDVDFKSLADVISKDPSMTMNVLRIANSAFYGLPNKVKSLDHAVAMLGVKELTSLCMSCGAAAALAPNKKGQKTMDLKSFWRHSVATGVIARIFAVEFGLPTNNLYLGGLMHDVGMVVLDRFFHALYAQIVEVTFKENMPVIEAETRVLGETHAKIGGWLMEKWKLPPLFSEIASFHHSIEESSEEHRMVVCVVSLANQVSRLAGFGFGGDETGMVLSETPAFQFIAEKHPNMKDVDIAKFVMDLDRADSEISELERMITNE
jgi:HD-like signal output (HDOD) protein